jgi:isopenicillin-N N-acyltransferase like protein
MKPGERFLRMRCSCKKEIFFFLLIFKKMSILRNSYFHEHEIEQPIFLNPRRVVSCLQKESFMTFYKRHVSSCHTMILIAMLMLAAGLNQALSAADRITTPSLTYTNQCPHGRLAQAGEGEDKIHVLFLWGTPFEMGEAHGALLKAEIRDHISHILKLMPEKMEQPVTILDTIYEQAKPFIPGHFMEELQGIAKGSEMPLQDVIRANLIGEASEWHCSLFGAWGKATAADGHLYQLRALDYETEANIQKHPVMVVYVPKAGHAFANLTWAGVVGCISGMSEIPLAISEIGDDYDQANDTFAGMPFMFMLRDILQFDGSLTDAISRVQKTPRTSSLMYGIGDGRTGQLRGFQTSHTLCNVYDPANLEPLTKAHQRLEDVVYWGMSWNVPSYDGPLHDKLVQYYGRINAEVTINDILPSVRTGSLQAVVYDLTAKKLWLANAKADEESGPLPAYLRTFLAFDMKKIFANAKGLAKAKVKN